MQRRRPSAAPLISWAVEREKIRLKRLAGQSPPWTDDPILSTYRFTNVRRADDRVSRWLLTNVLAFSGDLDFEVFVPWVGLCRWINWPPVLADILDGALVTYEGINFQGIGKIIDDRKVAGEKAWTSAYMIPPPRGDSAVLTKGQFVSSVVVGQFLVEVLPTVKKAVETNSFQATHAALRGAKYWGSFLAGQVAADLCYTPLLGSCTDLNTWAPQGPGSRRGFNRLMHRPLKHPIAMAEWCAQLQYWRVELVAALNSMMDYADYNDVSLMDVQNCLCEYDKYARAQNGEGRPKAVYKPTTEF